MDPALFFPHITRQRQWHTCMRHLLTSSGHVYFHPQLALTFCIPINPLSTSLLQHNIVPHFHHFQDIARHGFQLPTPIVLDVSFDHEFSITTTINNNGEHMGHVPCVLWDKPFSHASSYDVGGYVPHDLATVPVFNRQNTSTPSSRPSRRCT